MSGATGCTFTAQEPEALPWSWKAASGSPRRRWPAGSPPPWHPPRESACMTVPGTDGATQRRAPRTAVLWQPTSTPFWLPPALRRRTCWPVTPPAGSTRGSSPACTPTRWRAWSCSTLNRPRSTRSFPAGGRSTPCTNEGKPSSRRWLAIGIARIGYDIAPSGLPPEERAEQEADLSTAEYYRALHDELAELRTSLTQAQQVDQLR